MDLLLSRLSSSFHLSRHPCTATDVLLRVVETCSDMLTDRGCDSVSAPSDVDHLSRTVDEADSPVLVGHGVPLTHVWFHAEERVGVKHLRSILEASAEADRVIVVSQEGPTSFTKKEAAGSRAQFFCYRQLVANVTRHRLVPLHSKADSSSHPEKESYPRISSTDPVCLYYDFCKGDVVHVRRVFGSCRPYDHFRTVV
jgi:DNA-directed RNA polymerase subunit H (RpoH/RPB5)